MYRTLSVEFLENAFKVLFCIDFLCLVRQAFLAK